MRVVESFPHRVREVENVWIPMPDGCRLAARLWLPECAERTPVPAILESIPYRKRDGTRERDETMHRWFAGHGYAVVRIDIRGTGESDGLLLDEYTEQEQVDGVENIGWIAAQPWCTGAVGMIGKSWGGITALQIASRRPPALRAVIAVCATDDRWATDAHWMGGCLLNENLVWGAMLFTLAALPPDPALHGPRWRMMWRARLEHLQLFPEIWMRHSSRDAYWKRGSVCEDWAAIECPVYAVSGWADAYADTVPRLLSGLRGPRKGLVGPWAHVYPHEGVPGPAIGFLQEAKRWWDEWLSGVESGILAEPQYRVWMPDGPPGTASESPGRWVAEESWPSSRIVTRTFGIGSSGKLDASPGANARAFVHTSDVAVGTAAPPWCQFGFESGEAPDQRPDDARSLVFDSEPLAERLEILGSPRLTLALTVDQPHAFVAVRLNDVAPDGASHRVSYGLLDLGHRNGSGRPEPVVPGEEHRVQLDLRHTGYAFHPGHRLRVAISTSYWPVAWPVARPVTLTVRAAASVLDLPVRPPRAEDALLRPFESPEGASRGPGADSEPGASFQRFERGANGALVSTSWIDCDPEGELVLSRYPEIDLEVGHGIVERFSIVEGDPLSASAEAVHRTLRRRRKWSARVETRLRLRATLSTFELWSSIEAFEGTRRIFARQWCADIPRDTSEQDLEP